MSSHWKCRHCWYFLYLNLLTGLAVEVWLPKPLPLWGVPNWWLAVLYFTGIFHGLFHEVRNAEYPNER